MSVSAVVFDLGGVLTESPMTAFAAYEAEAGLPAPDLRTIVTADDLWADEMVERIAGRLGFTAELAAAVAP